ncbi:glycosyltransferase family 2 protein [Adhaeribacter radiodurans]|uniref:glycosyltransferase family 2 protein n=1 Tax=Adhaeribacter radiodurans TaxID=2745197 RepID=UPI001C70CC82|nr:glycosyltransferase [Adhaeribacter radiodurans]
MKKLSVIIVNYNVCYFLEQALLSVRKAIHKLNAPAEVFVVDNNSVDNSVSMLQRRFPEVKLIENKKNLGFSKANNQALRQATGEYVLLLNPDTVVEEDTFIKCCCFMDEHPEAGGLGVKMLDGTGTYLPESKRGLPTPWVGFYKIFGLTQLFPNSEKFARYYLGHLDKNQIQEVEVLAGAFMFLRRSVLNKIGLLDEAFFMYGEDIDLSYRIQQAGYKNYYLPHTRILHYKGKSTRHSSLNYVVVFYNAMAIFYRKHFFGRMALAYSYLIQLAIVLRAGVSILARILNTFLPFLDDAALLFAGLYGLKVILEQRTSLEFPPFFTSQVLPLTVILWIGAIYFNNGYEKPFKLSRFIQGIVVGTILVAALGNFWSNANLSHHYILWGTIWALFALIGKRFLYHYGQYKNFQLGNRPGRRIAIIGSEQESKRVLELLKHINSGTKIIGFASPYVADNSAKEYLGELQQLKDIIQVHKLNELIFCGKDLSVTQIIEWMVAVNDESVQYKILPEDSEYIIGSNNKNTTGEYYAVPFELNLFKKEQIRNKMLLDFALALIFLGFSPVLIWLVQNKMGFIRNCWLVLSGNYNWVGLQNTLDQHYRKNKAILTPKDQFHSLTKPDEHTIRQMEVLYAQKYSVKLDIDIIFKAFRYLGRKAI